MMGVRQTKQILIWLSAWYVLLNGLTPLIHNCNTTHNVYMHTCGCVKDQGSHDHDSEPSSSDTVAFESHSTGDHLCLLCAYLYQYKPLRLQIGLPGKGASCRRKNPTYVAFDVIQSKLAVCIFLRGPPIRTC